MVLRSELLEQRDRFRERLNALNRSVGHIGRRASLARDRLHVGALRDEVPNHLDVAARRRVMQGGIAFVIVRVHVGVQLLDEILDGREHAARREAMRVRGKPFAVADAGRRLQRRHARTTDRNGRQSRYVLHFAVDVARARTADRLVRMFGSAPYDTSSFIASTSLAYAARQNAVAPISSTPDRSKLYPEYHTFLLSRTFGSAPLSSSAFISSRYVVF